MSKKQQESVALEIAKKVKGTSTLVGAVIVLLHALETGDAELIARAEATHDALIDESRISRAFFWETTGTREPAFGEALNALSRIIEGLNGDLEDLGATPTSSNLRDRVFSVTTAIRDLAQIVADGNIGSTNAP